MLLRFVEFRLFLTKLITHKQFLYWLCGGCVVALSLLIVEASLFEKPRASATLLLRAVPNSHFQEISDEKEWKKLQRQQLQLKIEYHKQKISDPEFLNRLYAPLKKAHPRWKEPKALEIKTETLRYDRILLHFIASHEEPVDFLNRFIEYYLSEYFEYQMKEKDQFSQMVYRKLDSLENTILRQEISLMDLETESSRKPTAKTFARNLRKLRSVRKDYQRIAEEQSVIKRIQSGKSISGYTASSRILKYKKAREKLANISKKYKPAHPEIKRLRTTVGRIEGKIRSDIGRLSREQNSIVSKFRSIGSEDRNVGQEVHQTAALRRSLEINKKIHAQLNGWSENVLSAGTFFNAELQLFNLAHRVTKDPLSAKSLAQTLLMILLIMGMACVFIVTYLERRERRVLAQKYLRKLDVKTLGRFPSVRPTKKSSASELDLWLYSDPSHPVSEEIGRLSNELMIQTQTRGVRSVLFSHVGDKPRQLDVMSNVGISMSQKGKKVILLDSFWSAPKLHATFGLDNDSGLIDVLLGNTSLNDVIQMTEVPNLHILPAGNNLPSSYELLSFPAMKSLLEDLEKYYDFVFIEAPSCFDNNDLFTLGQYVQGVVILQDSKFKLDTMLADNKNVMVSDMDNIFWLGKVHLNQ